ncbi:hypothetical protein RP20_CCG004068 [Aedes albopictus]|nr:hypothetical protein RP20_CCG004068 [Aedes albopictus]
MSSQIDDDDDDDDVHADDPNENATCTLCHQKLTKSPRTKMSSQIDDDDDRMKTRPVHFATKNSLCARAASLSSAGNVMIRYSAVNWLISCLLTCDNTARTLLARTADVDSQRKNRQLLGHEFIEHTCPPASVTRGTILA